MKNFLPNDRPLNENILKKLESGIPTKKVPKQLIQLDWPEIKPFRHMAINTKKLLAKTTPVCDPYLPQWIEFISKPERPKARKIKARKLMHRGKELEPLFIWGNDERKVYHDKRYPWGCVCQINTPKGIGSGVIIGPRHVLTASHVINWENNTAVAEVYRDGMFVSAKSAITNILTIHKIDKSDFDTLDEDYCVLITEDRIGDRFGYFGVKTYDSSWDDEPYWWTIGYASDISNYKEPIYQNKIKLDEDEFDFGAGRAMTTDADLVPGQSGSPIFGFWKKGPYVVAVASANGSIMLSGPENWCAGGSALTKLVAEARSLFT